MSVSTGMANGTNKPGYINSFVSFLEGSADPDDPAAVPGEDEFLEELDIKSEIKEEIGLDPLEDEITPTDHTPASPQATDGENTNSSEATSMSEAGDTSRAGHRNVARRGKRKKGTASRDANATPPRENLRRSSRPVKRYGNIDPESDGMADSDPEFHLSDSDDDPDFNPVDKKTNAASDEEEELPRRGRGRGRGGLVHRGRGRGIKRPAERETPTATSKTSSPVSSPPTPKRRGRPPTYQPVKVLPVTESSEGNTATDTTTSNNTTSPVSVNKGPTQLSSAYNYAGGRAQRQQTQIMVPEGPQLTAEQLEIVESQFKSGDFVMAKKDMELMENPPIWRIDGKSLLQKFQAFEKDGKILYRNISTYSGWTPQAKTLYLGVRVTFVFQSRYDTVVQMLGFKPEGEGDDDDEDEEAADNPKADSGKQPWSAAKTSQHDFEIPEELRSHMRNFEVYLQTLISQALDNNFLVEIYEEKDAYFVDSVEVIDELAEERKKKILEIVKWNDQFKKSLDTWPCVNVMVRTAKTAEKCRACQKSASVKLLQLYGQPYNNQTLHSREPLPSESDTKNYDVCDTCSNISQIYNKVCHQKYDYYSQCKSKVTNMRVADPQKATTTILQDLLANDHWITTLFRSMCTTFIKVDRQHQNEKEEEKKGEETAAA
ncbi:glutamine and serine-rich protein 1-like [Eriocheir sinensis]|uniref:glutamine and serine-rich protein 1-like n=1 Tax=Eriocheir sinensis TaxID=95602 RepID=UPI0021C76FE0|nr:glutamine and serine-rich protein 1-like [Eriocheir sinensis]